MDESEKEGGDEPQGQSEVTASSRKGKSCKGYLYYDTALKSKGRNPRCIGISRTLPQVPGYIVSQTEVEASKEGRSFNEFSYACVGYSVFLDRAGTNKAIDEQEARAELPVCVGLEILVDKRISADGPASAPAPTPAAAHIHNREEEVRELPLPRRHNPAHSVADDFLSRFTRNANLIASGVARNMLKVGNSMKETLDDILYPYKKRPK